MFIRHDKRPLIAAGIATVVTGFFAIQDVDLFPWWGWLVMWVVVYGGIEIAMLQRAALERQANKE